ncbi:hypothetical protein [Prosthecobacter sp.]|uniref:hypothetical protein n=1 Tax=Prosthecobacter sp. TaxID=1965333 RepID=UPI0037842C0A
MRRPWIKIETCTPDKPEICSLATQMKMDEDTVVGKLVRLWSWAELNRINPNDIGVTKEFIDKLVGRKGFAAALAQTGWLMETNEKLSFRNFKRHNSPVAQNKALTAKRVARHRLRRAEAQEGETSDPLPQSPATAPKAKSKSKTKKPVPNEIVTVRSLPDTHVDTPKWTDDSIPSGYVKNVILEDKTLETKEESISIQELESLVDVTIAEGSTIETGADIIETLLTPQEALAALQVEEVAPKKRRSKSAVESEDQPMLF